MAVAHFSPLTVLLPSELTFCGRANANSSSNATVDQPSPTEVSLPCNACDGCHLRRVVDETRLWLTRTGDRTQTTFLLSLLGVVEQEAAESDVAAAAERAEAWQERGRLHPPPGAKPLSAPAILSAPLLPSSPPSTQPPPTRIELSSLLSHLLLALSPHSSKDLVYSRAKLYPGVAVDSFVAAQSFAVPPVALDEAISAALRWFRASHPRARYGFMLGVLRCCKTTPLQTFAEATRRVLAKMEASSTASLSPENHRRWTAPSKRPPTVEDKIRFYEKSKEIPIEFNPDLNLLSTVKSRIEDGTLAKGKNLLRFIDDTSVQSSLESLSLNSESEVNLLTKNPENKPFKFQPEEFSASLAASAFPPLPLNTGVDFIRKLPVHVAKRILNELSYKWLLNCAKVSQHWKALTLEVMAERKQRRSNDDCYIKLLAQGGSCFDASVIHRGEPAVDYAAYVEVPVPDTKVKTVSSKADGENGGRGDEAIGFRSAYRGVKTRKVIMEERNVFCSPASPLIIYTSDRPNRVVHTESKHGSKMMAIGEGSAPIKILSLESGRISAKSCFGHAGSVRCLWLMEEHGLLLSGSYDTTIRMWKIKDGKCKKIYMGHGNTINCLYVDGNIFASGSSDRTCKIWNLWDKSILHNFKHIRSVTAVKIDQEENVCVTATTNGQIKIWNLSSGRQQKKLNGHHDTITGIQMDKWHLISSSLDTHALVWSMQGKHDQPLRDFKHPSMVYSLQYMYLRVLTGCGDGRIRIFDVIRGLCIKTIRCTYTEMPILDMFPCGFQRLIVHLQDFILIFSFEQLDWNYELKGPINSNDSDEKSENKISVTKNTLPHTVLRANRMRLMGSANKRIIKNLLSPENPDKKTAKETDMSDYPAHRLHQEANLILETKLRRPNFISVFKQPIVGERSEIRLNSANSTSIIQSNANVIKQADPDDETINPNDDGNEIMAKSQNATSISSSSDEDNFVSDREGGDEPRRISFLHSPQGRSLEQSSPRRLSWPPPSNGMTENIADSISVNIDKEELTEIKKEIKEQVLGRKKEKELRTLRLYRLESQKFGVRDEKTRANSELNFKTENQSKNELFLQKKKLPRIPESALTTILNKEKASLWPNTQPLIQKSDSSNTDKFLVTRFIPIQNRQRKSASSSFPSQSTGKEPANEKRGYETMGRGARMMRDRLEQNAQMPGQPPPMLMYPKNWRDEVKNIVEKKKMELHVKPKVVTFKLT